MHKLINGGKKVKESLEKHFSIEWTTRVKIPALATAMMEGSPFIEPEHILVALLWREHAWLSKLHPAKQTANVIGEAMIYFPEHEIGESVNPPTSAKMEPVLKRALELASPRSKDVSPFYILIALLEEGSPLSADIRKSLAANGITADTARIELGRRFSDMS